MFLFFPLSYRYYKTFSLLSMCCSTIWTVNSTMALAACIWICAICAFAPSPPHVLQQTPHLGLFLLPSHHVQNLQELNWMLKILLPFQLRLRWADGDADIKTDGEHNSLYFIAEIRQQSLAINCMGDMTPQIILSAFGLLNLHKNQTTRQTE